MNTETNFEIGVEYNLIQNLHPLAIDNGHKSNDYTAVFMGYEEEHDGDVVCGNFKIVNNGEILCIDCTGDSINSLPGWTISPSIISQ